MKILVATAPEEQASELIEALLELRLIACGNILPPMKAIYRWKGVIERDQEVLLMMETTTEMSDVAIEKLAELHPYEVPKIYTLDAGQVVPAYLSWLKEMVTGVG